MQKRFIFAAFLCACTLLAFKKPPKLPKPKAGEWVEPAKPIKAKSIYGEWTWMETDCCGMRHGLSTPESTSDNIELTLKEDNSFMELHTKKNTLPRSGTFIMFKENEVDKIQFNDERPAQYSISANGDTLTISWKYLELQTEKYIRRK